MLSLLHRLATSLTRTPVPGTRCRRALATGLAFASLAANADIAQGPTVQAVTASQAGVWIRTSIDQPVRVRYWGPDGAVSTTPAVATSLSTSDDTARFLLRGLTPGTAYTYQVGTTDPRSGLETWTGRFTFETVGSDVESLNIAVLSDFKNKLAPSAALVAAIAARPDLLAVIGDLDHRNPANDQRGTYYPKEDAPTVLERMRSMHRDSRDPATRLGAQFFAGIVGTPDTGVLQIPLAYAWDDHDFCTNNADRTCPFAAQAVQAYGEYYVLAPDNAAAAGCGAGSDFESLSYGALVQVFFLDARSARDDANPDGATAMLGACQHAWLVDGLHRSKATWKIVLSPVPINPTMKPWDAWSHFPAERAALLAAIADVHDVVFVSGDVHSGGAVDDGEHSGRPEVSTPHAGMPPSWVNTFCRVDDNTLVSRPGSWTLGAAVDPDIDVSPMNCLARNFSANFHTDGLQAAVYPLDGHANPGYTWISATKHSLSVTIRDTNGNVKQGVRADRTSTPMALELVAE
jgi:alkaline phosphatase D